MTRATILVVDDEALHRAFLQDTLETEGHTVVAVGSAEAALEGLAPPRPDPPPGGGGGRGGGGRGPPGGPAPPAPRPACWWLGCRRAGRVPRCPPPKGGGGGAGWRG